MKVKKYKSYAVILFKSEKILKFITHYLKIFWKIAKSHLALIQAIFPMFNIIIKSQKDLRRLWNTQNTYSILVQMCF